MNPSHVCPECGKPVPAGSQHQLCPACLMAQAIASQSADGQAAPGAAPPSPEEIAGKFPQFEIIECLGRGGMGVVYKARQKSLNRLVAIKILAPEREHDARFAERFAREAELLAKLSHPRIVTIHDFGETGGLYYLVMEFVDGVNLSDLLRDGKLAPEQALAIVPEICDALQFAHEHGVVHRDIKPENVLLDRHGRVKVADFGLAKLIGAGAQADSGPAESPASSSFTEAGKVMGTPSYMAPEQRATPAQVDHRADIYALGVVLYQMLTGELPGKRLEAPSKKVQIDVRLDEIVLRALEAQPARRYQSAAEFRTEVVTMTVGADATPGHPVATPTPADTGISAPRFSRPAIAGVVWVVAAVFAYRAYAAIGELRNGAEVTDHATAFAQYVLSNPESRGLAVLIIGLLAVFLLAPFGVTILGWIGVAKIRRSAGKLKGLGLAVFDGLLFPLLALHSIIGSICFRVIKMLMGFSFDPNRYLEVWKPVIGPSLASEWAAVATVLTAITVDFFIIRAVWRRASQQPQAWSMIPPGRPRETSGAVGYTAFFFAGLSALIPAASVCQSAYFHWLKPGVDPWLSPQAQEIMSWLTLAAALLAIVPGLASRKSRPGTAAIIIGGYNLAIWLFFFVGAHFPMENNAPGWAQAPGFGPVIERVVTDGINLETGALTPLPVPHPVSPAASLEFANQLMHSRTGGGALTWAREQRLDVIAINRSLWGVDIQRLPLESPNWRALPAASLAGKLRAYTGGSKAPSLWVLSGTGASTFVFQTRDGVLGILEIVGDAVPAGVKIRYRLALDSVAGKRAEKNTGFGPVTERVINEPMAGWDTFVDFTNNLLLKHPRHLLSTPGAEDGDLPGKVIDWAKRNGADAMYLDRQSEDLRGLRCFDMATDEAKGSDWDTLSSEELIARLRRKALLVETNLLPWRKSPTSWLFVTRKGVSGILEITGFSDNPRGVKIRYKLAEAPAAIEAHGSAPVPAAPATPKSE